MNSAVTKPSGQVVHLAGYARWRDRNGNGFASCGALIVSQQPHLALKSSTTNLSHVTCPVCREQAAALGKAYAQARRKKEIEW